MSAWTLFQRYPGLALRSDSSHLKNFLPDTVLCKLFLTAPKSIDAVQPYLIRQLIETVLSLPTYIVHCSIKLFTYKYILLWPFLAK